MTRRPVCSESEIRDILRRIDAGEDRAQVLRRVGVSVMTFYRWRRQYSSPSHDKVEDTIKS